MNHTKAKCGCPVPAVGAPGSEARRAVEMRPCDECLANDIVYDIDVRGEYPPAVLAAEVRRLRKLLNECWAAAGLLGSGMTGQPYQAWEEPTDLLPQIEQLAMDAECYRESERGG